MLDVMKMKETCRICARELCGNQRRWIFHAGAKLNLQVLLSHALGRDLTRDGRGEFACSKCAFMLERMYRFDTVVARVEALSLERLHKLLLEKERLRQCIGGLYRRNNGAPGSEEADLSALSHVTYSDLVQDDLTYSVYESWADKEDLTLEQHQCSGPESPSGQKPRRCRGCAALRVPDSDYEAVCKVPRRAGRRSTSCGPSTRYAAAPQVLEDPTRVSEASCGPGTPSPASSVESLDTGCVPANREEAEDTPAGPQRDKVPEGSVSGLEVMLSLLRGYRPIKPRRGSKLPVLVRDKMEDVLPLRSPCDDVTFPQLVPELAVPCPHQELTVPCPHLEPAVTCPHQEPAVPCPHRELAVSSPHREPAVPCPHQELTVPCPHRDLAEMEEQWTEDYVQCGPFRFQQRLVDEQLGHYDDAAARCVGELQEAQNQLRSLQVKIRAGETRNQKLQERLVAMETELCSAREEAQRQERSIQNLGDAVVSKEAEAAELVQVIEDQNKMLRSLKELQVSGGETEVLALQASLFQAQLELQAGQRAQRQAARTQEDQNRVLERLEKDLQGALQHRRDTERHNQGLQDALEKAQRALQEREEQLRASELQRHRETGDRERHITELRMSLQSREQLVEDYSDMLEDQKDNRDSLLQKLRQRIKDRDRALERAVDQRFSCVEEKEEETRRLQLLLRDRDRDMQRQRCILSNNEETITSLEVLLRGRTAELQQVSDAWTSVQRQQRDGEDRQSRVLRERDAIIQQLQAALQARTQEAQDLRCSVMAQVHSAPHDVLEDLKLRLQLKDRLFQEVLTDRTHQAREHQEEVQDLLRTIGSRDQYIKDSASQLGEVIVEQTARLQELRRQLSSGLGSRPDSEPDLSVELQAVHEELRLVLRREKENQEQSRRTLNLKEEIIRDLQRQLVDPSDLPLVEQLTQEVQELRESLVQQDVAPARIPVLGCNRPGSRLPEVGGGHQRSMRQYL